MPAWLQVRDLSVERDEALRRLAEKGPSSQAVRQQEQERDSRADDALRAAASTASLKQGECCRESGACAVGMAGSK